MNLSRNYPVFRKKIGREIKAWVAGEKDGGGMVKRGKKKRKSKKKKKKNRMNFVFIGRK